MTTTLDRSRLLRFVKALPADCSLEDAVYRIQLWARLEESEDDIRQGRTISQAEVLAGFRKKWAKPRTR